MNANQKLLILTFFAERLFGIEIHTLFALVLPTTSYSFLIEELTTSCFESQKNRYFEHNYSQNACKMGSFLFNPPPPIFFGKSVKIV